MARQAVPTQTVVLGKRVTAEWWTLFRSPNLDTLVKQAIVGSRTLESAKARLAQAREAIAAASSALYPQVGFNAGVTQEKQTAANLRIDAQSSSPSTGLQFYPGRPNCQLHA